MSLAGYYAGGGAEPARLYEGYCFTAVAYVRHLVERRCLAAAERERVEQERQNLERAEAVLTRELGMWQFYGRGEIEPPLRLCYSSGEKDSSRSSVDLGSSMSRLGSSTARPTPSTSRLGSLSTISSSADQLKQYMKQRGLEAWHGHLSKHLGIQTVASLRAIGATDLRHMATAANMRLDQKTIDQVLASIRKAVPGERPSYASASLSSRSLSPTSLCDREPLSSSLSSSHCSNMVSYYRRGGVAPPEPPLHAAYTFTRASLRRHFENPWSCAPSMGEAQLCTVAGVAVELPPHQGMSRYSTVYRPVGTHEGARRFMMAEGL
eukprot:COSAG06_NODE_15524_length_1064_cov_1.790674_1_plen_321_part_01